MKLLEYKPVNVILVDVSILPISFDPNNFKQSWDKYCKQNEIDINQQAKQPGVKKITLDTWVHPDYVVKEKSIIPQWALDCKTVSEFLNHPNSRLK